MFSSAVKFDLAISWAATSPLPPLEGCCTFVGLWPLLPIVVGVSIEALGLGPLLPLWAGKVIGQGCSHFPTELSQLKFSTLLTLRNQTGEAINTQTRHTSTLYLLSKDIQNSTSGDKVYNASYYSTHIHRSINDKLTTTKRHTCSLVNARLPQSTPGAM